MIHAFLSSLTPINVYSFQVGAWEVSKFNLHFRLRHFVAKYAKLYKFDPSIFYSMVTNSLNVMVTTRKKITGEQNERTMLFTIALGLMPGAVTNYKITAQNEHIKCFV